MNVRRTVLKRIGVSGVDRVAWKDTITQEVYLSSKQFSQSDTVRGNFILTSQYGKTRPFWINRAPPIPKKKLRTPTARRADCCV